MQNQASFFDALDRARNGQSLTNYPAIFAGFAEKGIPESDILPRTNVLTFNAWKALGRSVKKGEHGVKVVTYVESDKTRADGKVETVRFPRTTTVFQISQTKAAGDATDAGDAREPDQTPAPATRPTAESQGFKVGGFINSAPRASADDRWIEE